MSDADHPLSVLYNRVRAFELVQCRMKHENILQRDHQSLDVMSEDPAYKREPLCHAAIRARRLGCAHTGARREFCRMLDEFPEAWFATSQIAGWKEQVHAVEETINQVDRQKNMVTLEYARVSMQGSALSDEHHHRTLTDLSGTIERLNDQHGLCVDQLRVIQESILAALLSASEKRKGEKA
ncbi:hypothetical protein [Salinisphaera sp. G21_0]|uniref:hypothetical protein n=1 Tax=Salinisphaera sp. G21_0 TaxID=2821094 RepID=UPI001ADCDB70|nr:hypothetical protein [Salinisphaera sp. G21_0]MBO9479966.1 hypothetical protein [Salinisphaera sp. G21_0]